MRKMTLDGMSHEGGTKEDELGSVCFLTLLPVLPLLLWPKALGDGDAVEGRDLFPLKWLHSRRLILVWMLVCVQNSYCPIERKAY